MDSFADYVVTDFRVILFYIRQHFLLVAYSVGASAIVSIGLALLLHTTGAAPRAWATRLRAGTLEGMLLITSAVLTVPSLALFVLLQPFFGLGAMTGIVGLAIYASYPILRNTVAGLSSVDSAVLESAQGVGMGSARRMLRVQLPLAWPIILSGIRVAVLITISIGVVAAILRGPGLGNLVLSGLSRLGAAGSFHQVLAGTLGALVVALAFELLYAIVHRLTVPRGIRV